MKPKFWMFQGQFDLECQGEGHQFSNSSENFVINTCLKFEGKIQMIQMLSCSQRIPQMTQMTTT